MFCQLTATVQSSHVSRSINSASHLDRRLDLGGSTQYDALVRIGKPESQQSKSAGEQGKWNLQCKQLINL
ncbi:hypothetical protein KCU90_g7, partial [Aureobasidium melanogenum]